MAPLLLLCCPQRPNWPPLDWRIPVWDSLLRGENGEDPSLAGHFWPDFQEIWEFLGGIWLQFSRALVTLQPMAFELVPSVRRGLNSYTN